MVEHTNPRINSEAFEALTRLLRLKAGPTMVAARLVMVDGLRPSEAAEKAGCTQQNANNTLMRCRKGVANAKEVVAGLF